MERIGKLEEQRPSSGPRVGGGGVSSVYIEESLSPSDLLFVKEPRARRCDFEPLVATLAARTGDPRASEFLCAGGIR
jgi:hypothetical protein